MDAVDLKSVEKLIEEIESKPSLLGSTSLSFLREFMTSLGCQLPMSSHKRGKRTLREQIDTPTYERREDVVEAEVAPPEQRKGKAAIDLESPQDVTEVIKAPPLESYEHVAEVKGPSPREHGDYAAEPGKSDAFEQARSKAMTAVRERKLEEAVEQFSLAISIDPTSSLMYCARANLYNKLGNPEAAVLDSTVALQINPCSTRARESLKVAYEMLGQPVPEEDELPPTTSNQKRQKKNKRPYSP